jgi:hypothetical protein
MTGLLTWCEVRPAEVEMASARELRRRFFRALWQELAVVWPILSGLIAIKVGLGVLIALAEGWSLAQGAYFAFITGLTIRYGDVVPSRPLTRIMAVLIGFTGVLLTGLVAALAVRALTGATDRS